MFLDGELARAWGSRVSHGSGADLLASAWRGLAPDERADRLAGDGDIAGAAATGVPGWASLQEGNAAEALRAAQERHGQDARVITLLEAEALVAAGAMVAGLGHLRQLSEAGSVPATVALARRQHALGDHLGAARSAGQLPMHATAAQIGARALLVLHRDADALRRVVPFVDGGAPIPSAMSAGAFAVLAAGALARLGHTAQLRRFAETLLNAPDAPPETAPTIARTAWIGGLARQAWERFGDEQNPWSLIGRLELAVLAGDVALIRGLMAQAGPLGAPTQDALALVQGPQEPFGEHFQDDSTYHIWRTHATRWQPWIDAASQGPGRVEVYDLAAGRLPDAQTVPAMALDDGALVSMVAPVAVPMQPVPGTGVWVDRSLCKGIGIGHDWPEDEQRKLVAAVQLAPPQQAAVWVTGADRALAFAHEGRPTVVLAPPGDPFWAGPLPQRAWPAFRVIRPQPHEGWAGASERIVRAVGELMNAAVAAASVAVASSVAVEAVTDEGQAGSAEAPATGEAPGEGEPAGEDEAPATDEALAEGEAAGEDGAPATGEALAEGEAAGEDEAPATGKAPAEGEAAGDDEAPATGETPAEGEAAGDDEYPGDDEDAGEAPAGAGDPGVHG